MQNQQDLLDRIAALEAENRRLREREIDAEITLQRLIQKLPTPAVALDSELKLMYANTPFVELIDYDSRMAVDMSPNLQGAELRNIVSEPVFKLMEGVHNTGEDRVRVDFNLPDGDYSISVFSIRRSELTIALVYNMNNPVVRTTDVVARLTSTIDRNMRMIQNIAFLLGEEVSENAKELGSVIKTLQYPDEQ